MGARARGGTHEATVAATKQLSDHLVAIWLEGGMADGWRSSGIADEWVPLAVAGLPDTRFYTIRELDEDGDRLRIDVVVHDHGLVTEWARSEPVGETVRIGLPAGSYAPPEGTASLLLAGDLTALPAIARLLETVDLPAQAWVESPDGPVAGYLRDDVPLAGPLTWTDPPSDGAPSAVADVVEAWPEVAENTYVWTAGESAQMRRIRRHLRLDRGLSVRSCNIWGYWRG